jgi:hypothetical protein
MSNVVTATSSASSSQGAASAPPATVAANASTVRRRPPSLSLSLSRRRRRRSCCVCFSSRTLTQTMDSTINQSLITSIRWRPAARRRAMRAAPRSSANRTFSFVVFRYGSVVIRRFWYLETTCVFVCVCVCVCVCVPQKRRRRAAAEGRTAGRAEFDRRSFSRFFAQCLSVIIIVSSSSTIESDATRKMPPS